MRQTLEEKLKLHSQEIEDPETSWRRVRELWSTLRDGSAKPEIIEAAIGVIHSRVGERLLLKRSPDDRSYPNVWCFPGGRRDFIKPNIKEPVSLTVQRETWEETGLDTQVLRKIAVRRAVHEARHRIYLVHCFHLKVLSDPNTVKLSHEHVDFEFFEQGSAPEGIGTITRSMFNWEPRG